MVTKVQLDTENRVSNRYEAPIDTQRFYDYKVTLQPEDYVFKPGHRIGVIVAGTNCTGTEVPGTDWCAHAPAAGQEPWGRTVFQLDPNNSSLTLPVAD